MLLLKGNIMKYGNLTAPSSACREMLQSSTVLNFHALRQRTQAIQPIIYRCHELSLQRIDLAITSESSHWTFSSWHRSQRPSRKFRRSLSQSSSARDRGQSAVVTMRVKLRLSFLSRLSKHSIYFIPIEGV